MRDNSAISAQLQKLGLSENEAKIFLTLLDSSKNPTEISRLTGIARSNVYRIVDELFERGVIREVTTENDKLLAAAEPSALELLVIEQENIAASQRQQFDQLLPLLTQMTQHTNDLGVKTYRGNGGLKQMLWNELKHEKIYLFSSGSLNPGTGERWAEKFRAEIIERNIVQHAIENRDAPAPTKTKHTEYRHYYNVRYISPEMLDIQPDISVHGDSISIYNSWTHQLQLGIEIHNPLLAKLMRQVFEHYWEIAKET